MKLFKMFQLQPKVGTYFHNLVMLALIVYGVFVGIKLYLDLTESYFGSNLIYEYKILYVLNYVNGLFMIVAALFGILNTCGDLHAAIIINRVLLVITLLGLIAAWTFAAVYINEKNEDFFKIITQGLRDKFGNYTDNREFVNSVQIEFECCGVDKPSWWDNFPIFPDSCIDISKLRKKYSHNTNATKEQQCQNHNLRFIDGCEFPVYKMVTSLQKDALDFATMSMVFFVFLMVFYAPVLLFLRNKIREHAFLAAFQSPRPQSSAPNDDSQRRESVRFDPAEFMSSPQYYLRTDQIDDFNQLSRTAALSQTNMYNQPTASSNETIAAADVNRSNVLVY